MRFFRNTRVPFRMTRRRFLAAAALGIGATSADALWLEPHYRVTISRHRVGVPRDGPAIRLVQLSDLHLQTIGGHERRVLEAVSTLAPDLVLLTGDAIDRAENLPVLQQF